MNTQRKKWAKFTHVGKETRPITKLFRDTSVRITFTTKTVLENGLRNKTIANRINMKNWCIPVNVLRF
jgi:hypothetical protein